MYKDIFCKVDLFAPLLGDLETIIPCTFDFDLERKKSAHPPLLKKVVEDNQTIIILGLIGNLKGQYFTNLMKILDETKWECHCLNLLAKENATEKWKPGL